ncbi:MAG: class II aldolase/adducin family protein [Pseudomonadota bacterium]
MTATVSTKTDARQQCLVRVAARALARANLVHAYGHCSMRLDAERFLVCAARPMSLIAPLEDGTVVAVHGDLPDGVLGEVRIHQQIYRSRPDIGGIVRSMPRDVMTLSAARVTPSPRHGMGSYFSPGVPLWDDPQLVRTEAQAAGVAQTLGTQPAVVMRGNGAVVAAPTLEQAVVLTWYLEDAARIELQLRSAGLAESGPVLSPEEALMRAVGTGRIYERMWEYLTAGDPEAAGLI